jgi:hypothetical protein
MLTRLWQGGSVNEDVQESCKRVWDGVGTVSGFLTQNFESCNRVETLTKPFGIQNHALYFYPDLFVCRKLRKPWPEFYQAFFIGRVKSLQKADWHELRLKH